MRLRPLLNTQYKSSPLAIGKDGRYFIEPFWQAYPAVQNASHKFWPLIGIDATASTKYAADSKHSYSSKKVQIQLVPP